MVIALVLVLSFAAGAEPIHEFYHDRYGLKDTTAKRVDNQGNGFEELYGTRNFREVLKGILFRGGANNRYHRQNPRHNSNPLPKDALQNLCKEGFKSAVYLYAKNFDANDAQTSCDSLRGANRLEYVQQTFSSRSRQTLEVIHAAIQDSNKAPVYIHCWNGWHASGMLSAFALMQFCRMPNDEAVRYWERNTDGTDDGNFQAIKRRIAEFKPFADLLIDPTTRARICPN